MKRHQILAVGHAVVKKLPKKKKGQKRWQENKTKHKVGRWREEVQSSGGKLKKALKKLKYVQLFKTLLLKQDFENEIPDLAT